MNKTAMRLITVSVLVIGALAVAYAWMKAEERVKPKVVWTGGIYDDDKPPYLQHPLDPRLIVLTPDVLAKAPLADQFTSPLGGQRGAFTYDAQPFRAPNADRGGLHLGQDLNGIGGMDTDRGDPVYASGRGRVVYCGEPSPDWGNVVVLLHRTPDGRFLQSLYAHLEDVQVRYGELVARGQQIGQVGTAGDRYPAHLHFEMMYSIVNEAGLKGYGPDVANRIDPSSLLNATLPSEEDLIPDPLPWLRQVQAEAERGSLRFNLAPSVEQKTGK